MKKLNNLLKFEKKNFFYFYKSGLNMREIFTNKLIDQQFIKYNKILKKKIYGNITLFFYYNSKISREFLLNPKKVPKYVWEPQTTKLILNLSKKADNIIFAGSFFGDQAILAAKKNKKTTVHAFEPSAKQFKCLKLNKKKNKTLNLIINNKVVYLKSNLKLQLYTPMNSLKNKDEAMLGIKKNQKKNKQGVISISIDDYCLKKKISKIDLLHIDVEGSEYSIIMGAKKLIKENLVKNIIFELNSNYVSWDSGLKKINIIKFFLKNNYQIFAIRDIHSSFDLKDIDIELLPLDKIYLKGQKHGFNMIATIQNTKDINCKILKKKLSPKYLPYKTDDVFHTKNLKNIYK